MLARPSRMARLLLLIALLVSGVQAAPANGAPPPWPPGPTQTADRAPTRSVAERWIVRLAEPPIAQAPGVSPDFAALTSGSTSGGRLQLDTPAARQYRSRLEQQQTNMFAQIRRATPAAQLQRRYQLLFNGMSVALPGAGPAAIERLRALPGVAAVYPDVYYQPSMFSSIPQIGADALWNSRAIGGQHNAGAGIKIAVIDAGIKIDNPFFNPAGFSYPPGYPKGDSAHTTPKVIVARAYFRPDLPPLAGEETPTPGPTASSHGTHVAGTAAGVANTSATVNGVTEVISGVAPRAYLMNYKVFYENDSPFSGQAATTELIAALEDAVADGADIINNSWGGRPDVDPRFDPIVAAAEAAVDAGVMVIFSAGNDGPSPSTAGSPGFSDKVISVGATTTARTIASGFVDVTAPEGAPDVLKQRPYGPAVFGPQLKDNVFGPAPYLPVSALGVPSLACDPLPAGALSGQVALLERGVCPFSVKVFNAQQAGAIAAMIYNSEAGGEAVIRMAAGAHAEQITIPAVSVPRSMGLGMIDWYGQHGDAARVQIDPRARVIDQTPDVLAAFSSRGPTFQRSLKPDVVAPGVNILSSGFGSGEGGQQHLGFGIVSGTSMAAPHVAGAAALLKQIHRNWSPADVKSALMSTAVSAVWLDLDRTQPASVLERGAGRIDVNRAASPGLLFDRPALSFGSITVPPGQPGRATLAVSARNVSGQPQIYSLSARRTGGGEFGISVAPATITLGAGASARFEVAIDVPASAVPGDYEGLVELQGSGDAGRLHLPLWARLAPAERAANKVLLIDNDGSSSVKLPDYSGYYGNALSELGVTFTYLDVDGLAGQPQTLPDIGELQKYEIVIWFTGDNSLPSGAAPVPTPLTKADQDLLIAYLQSGGNLIATGQNLAQASDINRNPPDDPRFYRSDLYHAYLGARFVQENVFTATATLERSAVGTAAQRWLADVVLDLSAPAGAGAERSDKTGAGNQASIDETTVVDFDPRTPDKLTTPILRAASTSSQAAGVIGLNRSAEPSLEQPALPIPYRSTYLAFGLEGVRSDTGATARQQLLQDLLYWHVDRPTVQVSGPVTVSGPDQVASFTATAQSNTPATFVRYRWDFGDGSPILETDQATVVHQYAKAGAYQARVEATDSWGHRAISGAAGTGAPAEGSKTQRPAARAGGQGAAGGTAPALAFAETGQSLQGRFLDYWRSNGGLPVFGYPITAQGGAPLAQVFERARFEYQPENPVPYDVLLGRLGVEALGAQGRDWQTFPTVEGAPAGCRYFAETRHSLCGAFRAYWERHGLEFDGRRGASFAESLALFGMPISEPQQETIEGGKTVMVQWFERARIEYHPENRAPYDVLLGRLGSVLIHM